MSIVFIKSGLSNLTLERGRLFPISTPIEINQDRYLTEDNNAKVVDYGSDLDLWELNFNYLSVDNYNGSVNGLKTWFESSQVNWSMNNFTLTDENGVAHTVRLWQKSFNMPRHGSGRYSISLILLKE